MRDKSPDYLWPTRPEWREWKERNFPELSNRVANCLLRIGCDTREAAQSISDVDLLRGRFIGPAIYKEIRVAFPLNLGVGVEYIGCPACNGTGKVKLPY